MKKFILSSAIALSGYYCYAQTDYITTNSSQTGLTGDKTTTGIWTLGKLGIGAPPAAGVSFRNAAPLTGSTIAYGQRNEGIISSDVTNTASYFYSSASTASAAFNVANLNHFNAQQGAIRAGSAVTNQSGFIAGASLTGASNNYGFRGQIPSGTNRWNLYMDGTANNYLAGNLSIGTTNAAAKLTVMGTVNNQKALFTRDGTNGLFLSSDADVTKYNWSIASHVHVTNALEFTPSAAVGGTTFTTPAMVILQAGNVGIGTTSPDQKLTVNGTIHSKQVKVDNSIPVPDYVFKKAYKLPDLNVLKTYLEANHHLPEIPSAAEIEKNGLNLGEMNLKLLKKVEELTLYIIDKDKQLTEQAVKLADQQRKNNQQDARIMALEKALRHSKPTK